MGRQVNRSSTVVEYVSDPQRKELERMSDRERFLQSRKDDLFHLSNLLTVLSEHRGVKKYDWSNMVIEFYPPERPSAAGPGFDIGPSQELCSCKHTRSEHADSGQCLSCVECAGWKELDS